MTREEEIQQLLTSVASILDDAMDQMDYAFHFAIITSYPEINNQTASHFIANVEGEYLEDLFKGATKAARTEEIVTITKGSHLQ
jgi:hypothetical protein